MTNAEFKEFLAKEGNRIAAWCDGIGVVAIDYGINDFVVGCRIDIVKTPASTPKTHVEVWPFRSKIRTDKDERTYFKSGKERYYLDETLRSDICGGGNILNQYEWKVM